MREVLPDLADLAEPLLRRVCETKEPVVNLELSGPTPADPAADQHFLVSYYPVLEEGEAIGIGAVVIEVTDRVTAQRELTAQAHLIYESVVQDLAVTQLAFESGDVGAAQAASARALESAKHIASSVLVGELFGDA